MVHHSDPLWRGALGVPPRRKSEAAAGFACPLVFSVIGALLDGAASFGDSGNPRTALFRFALIAGAPAVAALAALEIDGEGSSA
jgi:hypothetical protein